MPELIYGINPVAEALDGKLRTPQKLFLIANPSERQLQLLRQAEAMGLECQKLARDGLDQLVGHGQHQGAALALDPFSYLAWSDLLQLCKGSEEPLLLVLDGITDPHNFGALLRSAEASGCQGVVVAKDRSCPVTATVEKASVGALAHLPVCQVTNLARALERLKGEGFWIYGLAGEEGSSNLFSTDLTGPVTLVLGREDKGLRPNVRNHCDALLAIPLLGRLQSLNVSVAGGVALFEVVRQRGQGTLPA